MDPLYRSPRPAARRQVSLLAFCSMDPGQAVGFVEVGWPDRARLPLGGGVVDGERGSGSCRGRGVSPVDRRQPKAFSTATPTKAMARRGLFSSRWSLSSSAAVAAGVEVDSCWIAKDLGTWL